MSQNLVIPGADNKVRIVFGGIDLTLATHLKVQFGAELYTLLLNPTIVIVENATTLALDLNATTETGHVFATIKYFDGGSTLGEDITSRELGNNTQIVIAIGTQLIIEDGSIVTDANSFATDDELKAYASLEGASVPATQPDREALLILAMKYIAKKEGSFSGCRTNSTQELPFPRYGSCVNGFSIAYTAIHKNVKKAQMELALQAANSELFINSQNQNVQSEKLGDLEVSYFSGGSFASIKTDSADVYLKPLMINGGSDNLMRRV